MILGIIPSFRYGTDSTTKLIHQSILYFPRIIISKYILCCGTPSHTIQIAYTNHPSYRPATANATTTAIAIDPKPNSLKDVAADVETGVTLGDSGLPVADGVVELDPDVPFDMLVPVGDVINIVLVLVVLFVVGFEGYATIVEEGDGARTDKDGVYDAVLLLLILVS